MSATGAGRPPIGADRELRSALSPAALALGGANIVMQLARLPVGRGVAESRVDSGNLYKRPLKRARTTFGYVLVALFGTDAEREALGRAVSAVHRRVRSRPGDPVVYDAADPELQLWVAACIYKGIEDAHRLLHGSAPPGELYRRAARLATTLQVPEGWWPADRAEFEAYWREQTAAIEMDQVTRAFLWDFTGLGFLPWPFPALFGRVHRAVTAGFLPEEFRAELGLPWGPAEKVVFAANVAILRLADSLTPPPLRTLPFDMLLADMRRRIQSGRRVV